MENKNDYLDLCRSFAVYNNTNLWYFDENESRPLALQLDDGLYKRCLVLKEEEHLFRIIDCYVNFEKSTWLDPDDCENGMILPEIRKIDLENFKIIYLIKSKEDEELIVKAMHRGERLFNQFCRKYEITIIREIEHYLWGLVHRYVIEIDGKENIPNITDGVIIWTHDIMNGLLRGKMQFISKIVKYLHLTYVNIHPEQLDEIQGKISKNNYEFKKEMEAFLKDAKRKYFSLFDDFLREKLNKR